jgi:hypothetical protein
MSIAGLTKEPLLVTALVMVVIGAVACFAGYRVFRVLLALQGFIAGVILGLALANSIPLSPDQLTTARLILGLGGGLIGASLAWLMFIVAVFLSGAAFGVLISNAVATNTGDPSRLVLILVLALVGGIVALSFQRLFVVVSTAAGGALLAVSGAYRFLTGQEANTDLLMNPGLLLHPNAAQTLGTVYTLLLLVGVVLAVVGILVQYRLVYQRGYRIMT